MRKPELQVFGATQFPAVAAGSAATSNERTEREIDRLSGSGDAKTVSVPLSAIVPLLLDAEEKGRAWLQDFADDVVTIDVDLYDVLLAYQQLGHRSAA